MTTFLLVRHGHHLLGGGIIAGRTPDVDLSPDGRRQVALLADGLAALPVAAVYASPITRTLQTAQPLAERFGHEVQVRDGLIEIDYGDWTGARIDDLRGGSAWTKWNQFRSGHRVPNGESMMEVQSRIVAEMQHLRDQHPDDCIALVTHGDPIKAALAYFLGAPLDLFQRIEISTASVSVVVLAELGPHVLCVNRTDGWDELTPHMS